MKSFVRLNEIQAVSFANEQVIDFSYDLARSYIEYKLTGGYILKKNDYYVHMQDVVFQIFKWKKFEVYKLVGNKKEKVSDLSKLDFFEQISEYEYDGTILKISGWGTNEKIWYNWHFHGPVLRITYQSSRYGKHYKGADYIKILNAKDQSNLIRKYIPNTNNEKSIRINFDPNLMDESVFVDYRVTSFSFDNAMKKLEMKTHGASMDLPDPSIYEILEDVTISISDWRKFTIYNADDEVEVPLHEIDYIDDIIKWNIKDNNLTISGFGKKTHLWYDWSLEDPLIVITAENSSMRLIDD